MELGGRKGDEQETYPKGSIDSQEEEDEYRCYGRGVHVDGWYLVIAVNIVSFLCFLYFHL